MSGNTTKRVVTVCVDSNVAKYLESNYGGTGKKSWFVNEAIKYFIADVKRGKLDLQYKFNGNNGKGE